MSERLSLVLFSGTYRRRGLVLGVRALTIDRYRATSPSVTRPMTADWMLTGLPWVTGVTGFARAVYPPVALFLVALARTPEGDPS